MFLENLVLSLVLFCYAFQLSIAAPHLQTREAADGTLSPSTPGDINTYELGNPADPAWIAMLTNVTNGLPVYFPGGEEGPYPVVEDTNVTIAAPDRYARLARLEKLFPGIFWDKAYPDSSPDSCTFPQLNILEFATRVAVRLSYYNPTVLEDAAFQRYFITDGRVSGRWSNGEARSHYLNLISNLKQAAQFPSEGRPGKTRQKHRVAYQCGPVVGDQNNCAKQGVAAYTVSPSISEYGWVIVFCDLFFKQSFTDILTYNSKQPITVLDNSEYYTLEHIVMHEWMHNDVMGFPKHIEDIGGGKVYGPNACHERAWLNMNSGDDRPNTEVVYNSDNYAWTWTSREFARAWGWTDDDFRNIESVNANPFTTADIWTNLTGPMEPPINCVDKGTEIDCAYIGMPYDDYLLDQGAACNCTGDVCSSNSPSCCATSICPSCADYSKFTDLDDVNVPSCCASNTCLWESQTGPPTTTSSAPPSQTSPPPTGPCDCNEDRCTPESPPCCGDGSC